MSRTRPITAAKATAATGSSRAVRPAPVDGAGSAGGDGVAGSELVIEVARGVPMALASVSLVLLIE